MQLSNDLISKFVKITKDKTDVKTETTVYGTAVEYNDKMYVKLDGSDLLTPIETTTETKDGERVTVLIKDHTATITGNLSSPAVRTETVDQVNVKVMEVTNVVANKVSTEQLEAESARIDELVAENVTIKDTLTATDAKITNLEAEDANISGKLTAAEADIVKLEADIANIDAVITEDLEAINADIYNLEATYAEFDKATADEFTAVRGEITNLDSKYATIESLDVEKGRINDLEATSLTATSATIKDLQADVADIDTLIFGSASGNVIQSSFSNAVIAQLGNAMIKDAMIENVTASKITAGDIYTNNVRVLSEDGSLIISDETMQISDENRVRVQIGKDASNDYSINVWDADGNLMFSQGGITDSAIKEAIIRNDMVSENANISAKKLDIGSMFTVINEDGSHTLNSSKVLIDSENQTLNVAFASMTTNVTTAQATADTAQSSANNANSVAANALSAATNAQDDIDNLEIGGRNLILNSKGPYTSSTYLVKLFYLSEDWVVGDTYTLSLKGTIVEGSFGAWRDTGSRTLTSGMSYDADRDIYTYTFQCPEPYNETLSTDILTIYNTPNSATHDSVIEWIKLEKGNKATDWTPAPEDVDADIASAQTTADEANSKADTNASNIASVTTTVTSQGTEITAIQGQISSKIWQQDITTAINNLDIGARNLLRDSSGGYVFTGSDQPTVSSRDSAVPKLTTLTTTKANAYVWIQDKTTLPTTDIVNDDGLEWAFSLDVKVTGSFTGAICSFDIRSVNHAIALVIYATIPNDISKDTWVRIGGTGTTTKSGSDYIRALLCVNWDSSTVGSTIEYRNVKLEKGNKATDWTPAPEDMATTTEVNTLSTKYSDLEQTVDGLTSTVASHTTEISKKADGTTVATVSDKVSQLEQNIEGFKTTVSDTYSTKENLSDAISNLEIGGRNLLKLIELKGYVGGNLNSCNYYTINDSTITATNQPLNSHLPGFKVNCDGATEFMVSGKTSDLTTAIVYNKCFDDNGNQVRAQTYKTVTVTNNKFEVAITVPSETSYIHVGIGTETVSNYSIYDVKMEKGNKATDWTPAPEDVDAEISSLEGRMTTAETSITQTSTDITSLATRTTAVEGVAANVYASTRRKSGTINLTDTSKYDVDTYYPVLCSTSIPTSGYHLHEVNVQLNSGSKPSWSTHNGGFTCNLSCRMKAHGWGTVNAATLGWLDDFSYAYCDKMPAYITQNTNASRAIFYLRGGGTYFLYTNYDCTWTVYTSDITIYSITFSPTTTPSNHANLVNNWETVSRIGTAETKIIQNADSISSLADKTVVLENKFGEYPTIAEMNSAIVQKADSITSTVAATYTTKIDSAYAKLGNLVKNGYGEYLDATGWSGTTFTRGDCPEGCHGYFCNGISIDNIPYDPTKIYDYEFYVRLHSGRSGSNYFSIYPLDIDGNLIRPYNLPIAVSNMAYLAQDLKNGDTVVYFDDLSNWNTSVTQTYKRSFLIYGYKDSTGYTYPDGTYSRNSHMEVYADNSDVDLTNNTITLKSAWTGGTIASGTCIGQCSHGSTYVYFGQTGGITNTDWVFKSGEIKGDPAGDIDKRRLAYAKSFKVYLYNNVADYAGICIREQTIDKLGRTAAEEAQLIANEAQLTATSTVSAIEQLKDQISMLVVDGNNASLMTQTADGGWQFSMGETNTNVETLASNLKSVQEQADETDGSVTTLQEEMKDFKELNSYVKVTTYNEQPCIELGTTSIEGEEDTDLFKVRITNTSLDFMENDETVAYINNQELNITKATVEQTLSFGNFVWEERSNGNLGLVWKEVDS